MIDLHIPPLRERRSDIPALTEHILAKLTGANKIELPTLSTSALAALQQYHFPGNVRELENILERALALYDGKSIEIDDLNLPVSLHNDSESPESNTTRLWVHWKIIWKKLKEKRSRLP